MEILVNEYGAREIIFRDETFTVDKKHIANLCREIISRGLNKKVDWSCTTRVDCVTPDLLRLMKEAGCWQIAFGFEFGELLSLLLSEVPIERTRRHGRTIGRGLRLILPNSTRSQGFFNIRQTL